MKENLSKSNHSIVTTFKCGELPIMIETGRYKAVPLDERLCQICTVIEDKQHFIGSCSALSHIKDGFKDRFHEAGVNIESMNVQCIKAMLHPDCIKLTCELTELFEGRKILMCNVLENEIDGDTGEAHISETE